MNQSITKYNFKLKITADNENKIEEIKQNIKQLCSESNDYLKQNGDNIKFLEEEFNKKIQKINCDIENKIGETNQNSKKLIEENINQLKAENASKDEKINSVKEEIKNVNELLEKKIGNLAIELNNIYCKCVNFVKINNKWSEIDSLKTCCDNNCINTYKPIGSCIKGNGFGNLIDDENIKYLVKNGGCNNDIRVYAENSFKKPKNCLDYSLYYFEIKCKIEGELVNNVGKYISIGIKNCNTNEMITFSATLAKIYNEKDEKFEINNVFLNNNDIFGCGLVYPPSNKLNEKFPYVFFTQNGKQIGKGILLKDNSDLFKPRVWLKSCSVDANFGNDLQTNPFTYDISKHSILKEFY
ncbi:unnamed protein product [Meloidogyne enterolobii]|uniref:Uncharacterized protein n=1 Tax=Meloidogyne enterolobii TaxID=390850 RepID=A0ACB0YY63_MELEN